MHAECVSCEEVTAYTEVDQNDTTVRLISGLTKLSLFRPWPEAHLKDRPT